MLWYLPGIRGCCIMILLLMMLVGAVHANNAYNLSLAVAQSPSHVVEPNDRTPIVVDVVWDDVGTPLTVTARLNSTATVSPTQVSQASSTTQGTAKFSLNTRRLTEGRHSLDITATSSRFPSATLVVPIFVQDPIDVINSSTFLLTPASTVLPLPDGIATMTVNVSDDSYQARAICYWDWGTNHDIVEEEFLLPNDFLSPLPKEHVYNKVGHYSVRFRCRNTMSTEVALTSTIVVQGWTMSNFVLNVPHFLLMNNNVPVDPFPFSFTLSTIKIVPGRITAAFTYGDGSPEDVFILKTFHHSHMYPKRDVYPGSVTLSHHEQGSVTLNFSARVGFFQPFVSALGGLAETHLFTFKVECFGYFQGQITYYWRDNTANNVSDVSHGITYNNSMWHIYNKVGYFTPSFRGYSTQVNNKVQETANFSGPIFVDGAVNSTLELTVVPEEVLTPAGKVVATILLNRPSTSILRLHCVFFFDDLQNPDPVVWDGTLNPMKSFYVVFYYQTLGSHNIVVNCSNQFSEYTLTSSVFTYHPCFSADPIFDLKYGRHNPLMVLDSEDVRLVTRTIILCPTPSFHWWVDEYTVSGHHVREINLEQPNTDFIEFERGSIEPGLYRFKLNISFGPDQNNTWLAGNTYVRILKTPLVAGFVGGTIRLTNDPNATINGYNMSYDPVEGFYNKTGLEFAWQCQIYNTATLDDLLTVASSLNPDSFSSNCDDISVEISPGVRQLQVESSVTAVGYLFKLNAMKYNVTSPGALLYLQYEQLSFNIEVECRVNCEKKTAVSSPMGLYTVCDTCTETEMLTATYSWSLALYSNTTATYEVVSDPWNYFLDFGLGMTQTMVIKAHTLEPCRQYRIMAAVTSASGRKAFAALDFLVNCPPWGGNCSVTPVMGNVITDRFTLRCEYWQDDGFADPANVTDPLESPDEEDKTGAALALTYKFLLRKNEITVPIIEGPESSMPRISLPMIAGQGGGEYELVARVYDVLQDYTEVVTNIYLNASGVGAADTLNGSTITFWRGQIDYSDRSSTLNKQLRAMSTASAILDSAPLPDDRSALEKAADSNATIAVVDLSWEELWYELNNPLPNPDKDLLTEMTTNFTDMVDQRVNETNGRMSGQNLAALGEGMAAVLRNTHTADDHAVLAASEMAEQSSQSLKNLYETKPYPMSAMLHEAVFSMTAMIDKILAASLPSYDLSIGSLLFNSSDMSPDDSAFMVSRLEVAKADKERRKIDTTREAMPRLTKTIGQMHNALLTSMVLGQPVQHLKRDNISLAVGKMTSKHLGNSTLSPSTSTRLRVDSLDQQGSEEPDTEVEVKTSVFGKNPYAWSKDATSYEITSPVVKVELSDKKGARNLRKVTMRLKRGDSTPVPVIYVYNSSQTRSGPDNWIYQRLTLRSGSSAVVTRFQLPPDMTRVTAYFRTGRAPTSKRYDVRTGGELVPSRKRRSAGNATTGGGSTLGAVYQFFVPPGSLSPGIVFVGFDVAELAADTSVEYGFSSFSDMCRVWDEEKETWDPSTCTVSAASSPEETVCICTNPPGISFASSFFVAPNSIDFDTVFLKFDITNASVYGTLIGLFLLWILALLWARRKDCQDRRRWMVGYLQDNHVKSNHLYLMTVYTGMRRGAGTKSKVRFVVTGQTARTRVRVLSDGVRTLSTGSVLTYILTTQKSLGQLQCIRLWHDDSGFADEASWYLSRVVLEDLQDGQRYLFICERWFARDKEDGLIDRVVPATSSDEVMTFDKLFHEHTRIGITDSHLWLSCVMRPERSTFTRMQRVSCCMTLLLLTMITSALFYQPEDNETGESTNKVGTEVTIGPLRFSITTLWTSSVSIVITAFPIFLFVLLFRSYRPRPGPRIVVQRGGKEKTRLAKFLNRMLKQRHDDQPVEEGQQSESGHVEETLPRDVIEHQQTDQQVYMQKNEINLGKGSLDGTTESVEKTNSETHQTATLPEDVNKTVDMKERELEAKADKGDSTDVNIAGNLSDLLHSMLQQNPLPHWVLYVTWVLLVLTMAVCAYFLMLYSMQWGSTTSEEWLASFFISFFESFFLMDPVKVLVVACLLAYCAGNPFSSTQYQYIDLQRVQKEACTFGTEKVDRKTKPPKPVSARVLKASRKRRQQEQLAQRVFIELILYFIFVLCVFSLSYGNRDLKTYRTNKHLDNLLYSSTGNAPLPFESISSREDVVRYMNTTIRNSVFPWLDIVGQELHWRQRLYTSDGVSFRLGPVRVRQVRMPPVQSVPMVKRYPQLRSSTKLFLPYDMNNEETGSFCPGWKPTPCSYDDQANKLTISSWSYLADVLPVAIWGKNKFYPSGGYIADLTVNRDVVAMMVDELEEERWLDLQTMAVFVEMSVYNPNTNLFTFIRMAVEFPETGSSTVWRDMQAFRMYPHLGATGAYIFICQLLTSIFILVFTVKILLNIKSQKWNYFKDIWQVLDLMTILMAYVAMVFYVFRQTSVNVTMERWRYNPKVYVDFYLPVLWDTLYGYLLAAIVFIVSIRLLRVLGYNKRVTMLATVLAGSGRALLGYSVVFFIVINAYMSAGHMLFVSDLEGFRSVPQTYCTLYIVLLGTPMIGQWIRISPWWAQLYFVTLTLFMLFILYSMFEAILCQTIMAVKLDVAKIPPPYGLTNVVANMYRSVVGNLIPNRWLRKNGSAADADKKKEQKMTNGNSTEEKHVKPACSDVQKSVKVKKRLSSHCPDDVDPSSVLVIEDITAEVEKLKAKMREVLQKEKEVRGKSKARRKRRREKEQKAEEPKGQQKTAPEEPREESKEVTGKTPSAVNSAPSTPQHCPQRSVLTYESME